MKKIIIFLAIIISILVINKEEKYIIPQDAIRFRIIANSDSEYDQALKKEIIDNLSKELTINKKIKSIEEARNYIKNELPKFEKIVEKTLNKNNDKRSFHINYGKNYFPEKEYKDVIYEEGEYESLAITLGEGKGKNFWCVLFPPLCLIDKEDENIEYKSLIKDIIEKYF